MTGRCQKWLVARLLGTLLMVCYAPSGGAASSEREVIGRLLVSNTSAGSVPEVLLNGRLAQNGEWIFSGDSVVTGSNSSAIVAFGDGGFLQLDENTDPILSWQTFNNVRCILARIFHGQMYVDRSGLCIESPAATVVANSRVNLYVTQDLSVVTLLEGKVSIDRPRSITLAPAQEAIAQLHPPALRGKVRNLLPAELDQRIAWRQRYQFSTEQPAQPERTPSDEPHFMLPIPQIPMPWPRPPRRRSPTCMDCSEKFSK